MADGNTTAHYWNVPRLLIALALIATLTGATYYGWHQRAAPSDQRVFAGSPKDGIPSLTHPTMVPVDQVTYLIRQR